MLVLSLSYLLIKKRRGLQAIGVIFPSFRHQPKNLGSYRFQVIGFKNLKKGSRCRSLQQLFLRQLSIPINRLFKGLPKGFIQLSFKASLKTLKIL